MNREIGVGQTLRYFEDSIKLDFQYKSFDIESKISPNDNDSNIFFVNGDTDLVNKIDYNFLVNKRNILYWHWETQCLPDSWKRNAKIGNEVWVSSNFVKDTVTKAIGTNCFLIPIPVDFKVYGKGKSEFGIPNKFTLLFIYDKNSVEQRKNPIGLINAFLFAFPDNPDVCLVIKTNDKEMLRFAIKDKIIIINEIFSRQDIYELQNCADCFVSLHRSEGFGLNIAESMFLKKPVIATNWSGNTDFMNKENSFPVNYELVKIGKNCEPYQSEDVWAEPNFEHSVELIRYVVSHDVTDVGIKAKKTIVDNYSPEKISRLIRDRL